MRIILILLMMLVSLVFADNPPGDFSEETTLLEISQQTNIPVKKIAEYLELKDQINFAVSLGELNISNQQLQKAIAAYQENKNVFFRSVVIIGMSIVFLSLILVGVIISLLQHLGSKKQLPPKSAGTSSRRVSAAEEKMSGKEIIAAVAAFCLHHSELAQGDELKLTWTRPSQSNWKNSLSEKNRLSNCRRGK